MKDSAPQPAVDFSAAPIILQFCDVTYTYPGAARPAIDHLTLSLPRGARMALLGPNGAGKSTLMDLALRWKIPASGHIELAGRPLEAHTRAERGCALSLVPQDETSQFPFTLREFVLFGRAPHIAALAMPSADDEAATSAALRDTGLESLAHRSVGTLSGGERQLLLLARAMAQQTPLMLLDEPTSALDPANTAKVEHILRTLQSRGTTLLFTTHDPSLAARLSTHAALLKAGRLLSSGSSDAVLTAEALTALYDTPLRTLRHDGQTLVYHS